MSTETELLRKARATTDQLRERADAYHSRVEIINKTPSWTDSHKQELRRREYESFTKLYREHVLEVRRLLDEAATQAAQRLASAGDDTDPRRARAAGRVARMLDAGTAPSLVIEALSDAEDLAGLQALREELPTWAAANFASEPQVRRKATVEALRLAVDRAARPMLTGDDAAAVDVRLRVDDERALLDATSDYAWTPSATSRLKLAFSENPAPTVRDGHLDTTPAA